MALAIFIGSTKIDAANIHDAAESGNLEGVQQELANAVDVNLVDQHGMTALIWAAERGHSKIVQKLLAHNADVNHANELTSSTALMSAASHGYTEIVKVLLAHNADVNHTNDGGSTALMWAARGGRTETIKALLPRCKIDGLLAKNEYGKTAMDLAENEAHKQLIQQRINEMRCSKTKSARKVA